MYSLNYLAVFLLAGLGVENADSVVAAAVTIAGALIALYGRYRAGGLHWTGFRK